MNSITQRWTGMGGAVKILEVEARWALGCMARRPPSCRCRQVPSTSRRYGIVRSGFELQARPPCPITGGGGGSQPQRADGWFDSAKNLRKVSFDLRYICGYGDSKPKPAPVIVSEFVTDPSSTEEGILVSRTTATDCAKYGFDDCKAKSVSCYSEPRQVVSSVDIPLKTAQYFRLRMITEGRSVACL